MDNILRNFLYSIKKFEELTNFYLTDYNKSTIMLMSMLSSACAIWLIARIYSICYDVFHLSYSPKHAINKFVFKTFRKIPYVQKKINDKLKLYTKDIQENSFKLQPGQTYINKLPTNGLSIVSIKDMLQNAHEFDKKIWNNNKLSGSIYKIDKELNSLLEIANNYFMFSNPLHPSIFPSVRKMEAEAIRMVLNLYNGDSNSCGVMSSGGTESIFLSVKTYRDRAITKYGHNTYEIICPITAHAAFEKSCQYLNVNIIYIPVDKESSECDVKLMEKKITKRTVLLVGSCPNFPHGIIDPIDKISDLAKKYGIGCHVDCCLGGFIVPFCESLGYLFNFFIISSSLSYEIPLFDFRLPGVTSISCDSHKYGYSSKGSSFLLYRDKSLRAHQYSITTNWPGGIYGTSTIHGSRCGSPIATTWASLMYHGFEGYKNSAEKILEVSNIVVSEIKKIKELQIIGRPRLSVVSFTSNQIDIFLLMNKMVELKWDLNPLQFPSALHLCITDIHVQTGSWKIFLQDLSSCVESLTSNTDQSSPGACAIYGTSQNIPDRSIIAELTTVYIDSYYQTS